MSGKLYVVGVGPGDPELITLKGVRILNSVPCIFVPKGREEGSSLALSIVTGAVDLSGKEIIEAYFPMKKTAGSITKDGSDCGLDARWHETVEAVLGRLHRGLDVSFITIGDPTIYSTFYYLHERILELDPTVEIIIIPGVSSINAVSARAGKYLAIANEKIAILPATYEQELADILDRFDTVVLMKVGKVFKSVRETIVKAGLLKNSVYVTRVGMQDEKVIDNLNDVTEDDLNYFSIVIIKK